jgi:predicted DNA binding CopG/RHH family protein
MKNKIPKFRNESEEVAFWDTHDSTKYIDWSKTKNAVFPNLRPSLKSISLRLPESMIAELRLLANKKDVPYQSLLKMFLSERIAQELQPYRAAYSGETHGILRDAPRPRRSKGAANGIRHR